jgi:hypothetical protein
VKGQLQERLWGSPVQPSEGGYGQEVLSWTWLLLLDKWKNNVLILKKGLDFQRSSLWLLTSCKENGISFNKMGIN